MKLTPIEKPNSLWTRLAFLISKLQYGKVLTPLKVVYARKPCLAFIAMQIARTLERGLSLEPSLRLLAQIQVSRLNGCTFCEDLALSQLVQQRIGKDKFRNLAEYKTSNAFSERE